jgi:hypothetical protein
MLRLEFGTRAAVARAGVKTRRISAWPAVAAATFALTSAVSAESLAQPADASLEARAADYVRFREDVEAVEKIPFTSAEVTREAHRRLAAHDARALSGGWVAYAALVAADSPEFRKAIADEVGSAKKFKGLRGRDALMAKVAEDPAFARSLKGANDAVAAVRAMTAADAARFADLAEVFKAQAYAMQKTSWGKAKIPPPPQRLQDADKFAAARPASPAPSLPAATDKGVTQPMLASAAAPWGADWGAKAGGDPRVEPSAEVVMERVLALAARYAAGGVNAKLVDTYAKNDRADQCLSMARLTLRQCIAATRAPYEEAFCLGEHALGDPARCLGWAAGAGS